MTDQISKKFAASCVAEWSGTTGYPDTREGLLCLIDTFQKVSEGEAHARRIVEDLQADSIYCPRPAEIRRVAISIQTSAKKTTGCPECDWTTWVPATLKHSETGRLYEAVTSCACTSREQAPAKAKQPKAKQRELMPIAKVAADYPD